MDNLVTDDMLDEVKDMAKDMTDEVLADLGKQNTPKGKHAAFQSWVIWRLAVLQVTFANPMRTRT